MKKFIQVIPINYKGALNILASQDYFARPINIMNGKGYDAEIITHDQLASVLPKESYLNVPTNTKFVSGLNLFQHLRYLRKNKNALILANSRTFRSMIAGFLCHRTIFVSHQSMAPQKKYHKLLFWIAMNRFKKIIVHTPHEKEMLIQLGINEEKIHLIPLAIDHDYFSREVTTNLKEEYGIKSDEKVILFLANVREVKNIDVVLTALRELKGEFKFKFVVVGEDMLPEDNIMMKAGELGLTDDVIVTGLKEPSVVREWLSIGDVMVNSSFNEGQCLAVYEGAAAGIPLCLSRIGPFTSVFTGYAKFHDNYYELAENISESLNKEDIKFDECREMVKKITGVEMIDDLWKEVLKNEED